MKFQRTILIAAACFASAAFLSAQDVSDQDAARILNDSAWSMKAKTSVQQSPRGGANAGIGADEGLGNGGGPNQRNGANMSAAGGQSMGGMNDGMGGGGGGGRRNGGGRQEATTSPKIGDVTLRWESASTVKQALTKAYGAEGVASAHDDYYVVTATGLTLDRNMMGGGRRGGSDSSDVQSMQQQVARMLEGVRAQTTLNIKGKGKLQAAKVDVAQRGGQRVLFFLFPRDQKITGEEKEMDFESHVGMIELKGKFKPKDMMSAGKLDI